ncbi:MAG: TonB-dependent receptor plug domain-containing protein [Gammaproteobacteria bacterium]|nr:TonB-dependent receptor plug domain-containing protein [Gammaproteobacteria bacterium]
MALNTKSDRLLNFKHNNRTKKMLFCVLISFYGTTNMANELSEDDFFDEKPIVLNASRLTRPANESPVPVSVIDRDMIEASGFTEISDLFRLVPGFIADYYRGNNNITGYLFIDDARPRMLQVMVDGRSVYTPMLGGPIWESLPLNIDDIERIEVVRGPAAASYGSNAYLGVINIITRSTATLQGWSARANIGEPQLRESSIRYGGQSGKWGYRFSGWTQKQEGFKALHDGKTAQMFSSRMEYQQDRNNNFDIQFGASNVKKDRDEPDDPTTPDHTANVDSNFQMIRWDRTLDKNRSFYLKYYHNYDNSTEFVNINVPGIPPVPINLNYSSRRHDLEFQMSNNVSQDINLAYGGSIRRDIVKSPTYTGKFNPVNINVYRSFFHGYWNLNEKFFVNTGLMIEKTNISSTNVLPLTSLHYRLTPQDTLRLSLTRGSRLPVAFEEKNDTKFFIPNTAIFDQIFFTRNDLNSEIIDTVNIGLTGKKINPNLSYDISYSHHHLKNILSFDTGNFPDSIDGRATFFDDQGEVDIDNLEIAIGYTPSASTQLDVTYAYTETDEKNIFNNSETIDKASPRHNFSLLIRHKINHLYKLSTAYYYIDKARYIDNSLIRPSTDRVDMRLARKLKFQKMKGELALVGQDLLNSYQGIYVHNKMDRRFYLSLKLDFF